MTDEIDTSPVVRGDVFVTRRNGRDLMGVTIARPSGALFDVLWGDGTRTRHKQGQLGLLHRLTSLTPKRLDQLILDAVSKEIGFKL